MGHEISLLPDALPEDVEDVAWALQTATALWNRGERKEALVWLRRAADAASAAGNQARAEALKKNAADLDHWLIPSPRAEASPEEPAREIAMRSEARRQPQPTMELEPEFIEEETNDLRLMPPVDLLNSSKGETPPSRPMQTFPSTRRPSSPPESHDASRAEASRPQAQTLPAAVSRLGALADDARESSRKPTVNESLLRSGGHAAPAVVTQAPSQADAERAARIERVVAKKRPRAPILDPWSDDLPPSDPPPRTVHNRSDLTGPDDADVLTSAPPLEVTLKRKPPPPPPKRSGTFPGTILAAIPESPESKRATEATLEAASRAEPAPASRHAEPKPAEPRAAEPKLEVPADNKSVGAAEQTVARPPPPRRPTIQPRSASIGPPSQGERKSVPPPAPFAVRAPGEDRSEPPPATLPAAQRRPTVQPRLPLPARPSVAPPAEEPKSVSAVIDATPVAPEVATLAAVSRRLSEPAPSFPPSAGASEPLVRPRSRPPSAPIESVTPPAPAPPPQPSPAAPAPAPAAPTPVVAPSTPPPAPPRASSPPASFQLHGVALETVEGLTDLTPAAFGVLLEKARIVELGAEEEVASTGAILLLNGSAVVCATVSDAAAQHVQVGALAPALVSRSDATRIRVVATGASKLATWDRAALDAALVNASWVRDELVRHSDRLSALAGSTMGPLGDLDESSRFAALERMSARSIEAGSVFVAAGAELPGLTVVGSGTLVLADGSEFGAGDFVLPQLALEGGALSGDLVAGSEGAVVLSATRMGTVELFSVLPTLLELLRIS
jgi:hypothetical protein